jgi:hypothetical protein
MKTPAQLSDGADLHALRARLLSSNLIVRCPASDRLSRGLGRIIRNWEFISRQWVNVTFRA